MGSDRKHTTRKDVLKSHRWFLGSHILVFIVGVAIASIFWSARTNSEIAAIAEQTKPLRQPSNSYEFINPLIGYSLPDSIKEFDEYRPLKTKINDLVAQATSSGPDDFGVYFRDLTLGRWMGINENVGFSPGSMMKVLLMIAYFKEAENHPAILQQTLTYSSSTADQLNGIPFEIPSDLQVGKRYTVEQLIETMIINSDNGAKNALLDNINLDDLGEISSDLGFPALNLSQNYNLYAISPKQYSIILRVLYNATYLSRGYSEQALEIMSRAKFEKGLVAGVPKGTVVAHKFGESVDYNNDAQSLKITISNCGVVYHSSHPYTLCVMAKGKDANSLEQTIASISQAVWDEVNTYAATDK